MAEVPVEFRKWVPDGFQTAKIRRPRKNVPEWANSDMALRWRIFGPALRRYRIAYLYWRCGWNAREVAEEMRMAKNAVEVIISRLKLTRP